MVLCLKTLVYKIHYYYVRMEYLMRNHVRTQMKSTLSDLISSVAIWFWVASGDEYGIQPYTIWLQ